LDGLPVIATVTPW